MLHGEAPWDAVGLWGDSHGHEESREALRACQALLDGALPEEPLHEGQDEEGQDGAQLCGAAWGERCVHLHTCHKVLERHSGSGARHSGHSLLAE